MGEEANPSSQALNKSLADKLPKDEVEYIDVREQTIFRYSSRPEYLPGDKRDNRKASTLSYIHNNQVRTNFKTKSRRQQMYEAMRKRKNPFLDQKLIRQTFNIDRRKSDWSMVKDKS